ncbi:MAG: hypothetical protein ABDH21_03845 [bacterium]
MTGINPNINPNDLVKRLSQQGAKQAASTYGAMYQKTTDQQKVEKQSYDVNQQYQILDKHNQAKELEKNAKDASLVSQSLTNKELDEDAVMIDQDYLLEEGIKGQGLLARHDAAVEDMDTYSATISGTTTDSATVTKDNKIFHELASKLGVSAEKIETAARQEVQNQLETNKAEMTQIKFPHETSQMELQIYQDSKPASAEIKENRLIVLDNNPLDIDIAEKEF